MSTRQVQLTLPSHAHQLVLAARTVLNEGKVNFTELRGSDANGEGQAFFMFTVPTLASGQVLERLADLGVGRPGSLGKLEVLELRSSSSSHPRCGAAVKKKYRVSDRTSSQRGPAALGLLYCYSVSEIN